MAKGDATNAQNTVAQNTTAAGNVLNTLGTQNQGMTQQFQNNYTPAVNTNTGNYSGIMNSFQNFAGSLPNAGSLYSNFLAPTGLTSGSSTGSTGGSTSGSSTGTTSGPNQMTGDPNTDAVLSLYNQYGIKAGGPGSGLTDVNYWSQQALSNAGGDSGYTLGRLQSDLAGTGPDAASGGGSSGGGGLPGGLSGMDMGALTPAIAGYDNFAQTGGFSPTDIQNIRARSIAPIRSMADQNAQDIQRQAAIRGTGYSPNTAAALALNSRNADYSAADAATNAEAGIAQLQQQGKLYGLGGLSSTGLGATSAGLTGRGQNLNAIQGIGNQTLGATTGQTGLYGATPGLTSTFGNQLLGSTGQGVNIGGLSNQLANISNIGTIGAAGIPSTLSSVLGNTAGILGLAGSGANGLSTIASLIGGGTPAGTVQGGGMPPTNGAVDAFGNPINTDLTQVSPLNPYGNLSLPGFGNTGGNIPGINGSYPGF